MNRHPGFSPIVDPTPDQLGALHDAVAAGRITKLIVEDGKAYFRRAPGCEGDRYPPREVDVVGRLEELEGRLDLLAGKQFIDLLLQVDNMRERVTKIERSDEVKTLKDSFIRLSDRTIDNAAESKKMYAVVTADCERLSRMLVSLRFVIALFAFALIGAIIALTTR